MANESAAPDERDDSRRHRTASDRPRKMPFGTQADDDTDVSLPVEQEFVTPQKPPMRRLSLNLPESLYEDLAMLAESQGKTMTEIVRTGLGLAHISYTQVNKRQKLMITDADGKPIREILIPR